MTSNYQIALRLGAVVVGMFCLAYAGFPLYNLFCKVTGYGGTTQEALVYPRETGDKPMEIRFNADVNQTLPWRFKPVQKKVIVKPGEKSLVFYEAENTSDKPLTGVAVYNVTPDKAGVYFSKVQCFCFDEQTLQPYEIVQMPVSFFVDPEIEQDPEMKDVRTITLSYTFFEAKNKD